MQRTSANPTPNFVPGGSRGFPSFIEFCFRSYRAVIPNFCLFATPFRNHRKILVPGGYVEEVLSVHSVNLTMQPTASQLTTSELVCCPGNGFKFFENTRHHLSSVIGAKKTVDTLCLMLRLKNLRCGGVS